MCSMHVISVTLLLTILYQWCSIFITYPHFKIGRRPIFHSHTFYVKMAFLHKLNLFLQSAGASCQLADHPDWWQLSCVKSCHILSINSSALILFFIGKIITGFCTLCYLNTHPLRPQHHNRYHNTEWGNLADFLQSEGNEMNPKLCILNWSSVRCLQSLSHDIDNPILSLNSLWTLSYPTLKMGGNHFWQKL